jgi:hypothetical protein
VFRSLSKKKEADFDIRKGQTSVRDFVAKRWAVGQLWRSVLMLQKEFGLGV